jgi:hypothetical protein
MRGHDESIKSHGSLADARNTDVLTVSSLFDDIERKHVGLRIPILEHARRLRDTDAGDRDLLE